MKIVIISQCIYPRVSPRSFRATELAKYFAKNGHDVHLYASLGKYDYTGFEKETGIHAHSLGTMHFSTLNSDSYRRNNFLDRAAQRVFGRFLEYPDIEFVWKTKKVLEKLTDVDLLITIAIPHPIHWGAAWAKKKMGTKFPKVWISDCGDPFMGNTVGGDKHPAYFQKIEDFWGEQTDYITIPLEDGRKGYSPKVQDKIRIIPQGFDFSNVKIDKDFKGNKIPHFAYAGATYPGYRDPTLMLQFLSTLKEIDFRFKVYTKAISFFEKFKKDLGEKLIIKSYVPREQLLFELSQMDFLVNMENNSTIQSPSKLIDYYLTQRPIIDITTNFHEKSVLLEFLAGNYSHKHNKKDISQFDINNVGAQFLRLISSP